MAGMKSWIRVPDGSKFRLSVLPAAGAFASIARMLDSDGHSEEWSSKQVTPGPASRRLKAGIDYGWTLEVTFGGAQQVTVKAEVVKPDGMAHGKAYTQTVKGKKGEIERWSFHLITAGTRSGR